jgi:Ser/Thr protein kinase RdoA (MazF antagonist)
MPNMCEQKLVAKIAERFALPSRVYSTEKISAGLINHTFLICCKGRESEQRFILQELNSAVFPEPWKVMENILIVTAQLRAKHPEQEQLQLVPLKTGQAWLSLPDQSIWRCYAFLEGTETFVKIDSPQLAYRAAAAFGSFQATLDDLEPTELHETIPNFHHTPSYLDKLRHAIAKDPCGRLKEVQKELDFIMTHEPLAHLLVEAGLPIRITHNDTKISNILFPIDSSLPPIVIDLDTVMPGLALFDFGDLVRSAASSADENETDLSKVFLNPEIAKALADGYLSTASEFLTAKEKDLLPLAPKVITYELAIRFLTDYLLGDIYFKIQSPDHNLRRARNQLALMKSM